MELATTPGTVARFHTARELRALLKGKGRAFVSVISGPRPGFTLAVSKGEIREYLKGLPQAARVDGSYVVRETKRWTPSVRRADGTYEPGREVLGIAYDVTLDGNQH